MSSNTLLFAANSTATRSEKNRANVSVFSPLPPIPEQQISVADKAEHELEARGEGPEADNGGLLRLGGAEVDGVHVHQHAA